MFDKKETKKDPLAGYKDTITDFTNQELKAATWFVVHKEVLQKIGLWSLIVFDVLFLGYGLIGWGSYAIVGYTNDRNMLSNELVQTQNYKALQPRYRAQRLQFSSPTVFENGEGNYLFATDVENNNDSWIAHVTYAYEHADGSTDVETVQIMPHSRVPLVQGQGTLTRRPATVRFLPKDISWERIDPHTIPKVDAYLEERNAFRIENMSFSSAGKQGVDAARMTFDLTNQSVFSYWSPLFVAELLDGVTRVGVIPFAEDQFLAGETRTVDLRSFSSELFVSDIVIHPLVNFFDEGVYIAE